MRSIRTNDTTNGGITIGSGGGGSGGGGGLSSAQVQSLIDTSINDKSQWILDREESWDTTPLSTEDLLVDIDFDEVQSYYCIVRGFAKSGSSRFNLLIQNDGTTISGSSQWSFAGQYGSNNQQNNTTISNGNWEPSQNGYDSYQNGPNTKILIFHLGGKTGYDGAAHRYFEMEYRAFVPAMGGYQSYYEQSYHSVYTSATWNGIKLNGPFVDTTSYTNPIVQVYKQLRVPAS